MAPGAWAASSYQVIYKFSKAGGDQPQDALLVFDAAGSLYGTTFGGGKYGGGTVFKLARNPDGSWTQSVLYNFDFVMSVRAGVIFDASGNLYGTTWGGGGGCGTVFKLTHNPDGSWTNQVIYSFTCGNDGGGAVGGVILDAAGALYGTTAVGGASGGGVVYKLTPNPDGSWTQSVLHSFDGTDGGYPDHGSLVFDTAGNLYGASAAVWGPCCGTIFELMPQPDGSWKEVVLHHFSGGTDGGTPESTLIFDQAGGLYGTASSGGLYGMGVVFKLTRGADGKWREHVIHHFNGANGATPFAGVVFDAAGNLFGTTVSGGDGKCRSWGGSYDCGVVYKLVPNPQGGWTGHVLHYQGLTAGLPFTGVVVDSNGVIYGMGAGVGIPGELGGVFEITP
jgi:uncharacterized repeat protein (TIGR03803 family)